MPAESRPGEVGALCGDSEDRLRFINRGQRSGNQARARETRRVPNGRRAARQEQRRLRRCRPARRRNRRADPHAGLCLPPLKHETFLDLGVIMLGAGSTRFHAEQTNTLVGGRVEEGFVYCAADPAGRGTAWLLLTLLHRLYGTDVNHRPAWQLCRGTADRLDADRKSRAVPQVRR